MLKIKPKLNTSFKINKLDPVPLFKGGSIPVSKYMSQEIYVRYFYAFDFQSK